MSETVCVFALGSRNVIGALAALHPSGSAYAPANASLDRTDPILREEPVGIGGCVSKQPAPDLDAVFSGRRRQHYAGARPVGKAGGGFPSKRTAANAIAARLGVKLPKGRSVRFLERHEKSPVKSSVATFAFVTSS